jgi:hypothetical protein
MKPTVACRLAALAPLLSLALLGVPAPPAAASDPPAEPAAASRIAFRRPPVRFEPNLGQADSEVRFLARGSDATIFLTAGEAVLRVVEPATIPDRRSKGALGPDAVEPAARRTAVVRLKPVGADPRARAVGLDPLPGVTNYFIGDDPARWRTDVPGYARVCYQGVYPGVDMVYYGNDGRLEYDFVLAPGADARRIAVEIDGADSVDVDASGDLVLRTPAGDVRQPRPTIYQQVDGQRRPVAGGYTLRGAREVGFALGAYDPKLPLVIDPQVVYSTYLGGSVGSSPSNPDSDFGNSVAAGPDGSVYVVGSTFSGDFPTRDAMYDELRDNADDAFITKLGPDGELVYSTYFGGTSYDYGHAVEVDATGAVYVAGVTGSSDFPTRNPLQRTNRGYDLFLSKLSPDGRSLVYSTYLGGSQIETPVDVKVNAEGAVFLVGDTSSPDFPLMNPTQETYGGGQGDAFLSVIAPSGTTLEFSTYEGGPMWDVAASVAIDEETGAIYFGGGTDENPAAATAGEASPTTNTLVRYDGEGDTHYIRRVIKEILNDTSISYPERKYWANVLSFYIRERQKFYVGGAGTSAPRNKAAGGAVATDVNVALYDRDLGVVRTAAFGGSSYDDIGGIAGDSRGALYVTGTTSSRDLPLAGPVQADYAGGGNDGFVVVFAPESLGVAFATYLGSPGLEYLNDVAVDPAGNMFITGYVLSPDFPTTPGAPQPELRGRIDAFVVKISAIESFEPDFGLSADPSSLTVTKGQRGEVAVTVDALNGFDGRVTVTAPDTRAIKVKMTPAQASTDGGIVTFNYKVKKKAQPGTHELVFTGRDAEGRERTAVVTLTIQ